MFTVTNLITICKHNKYILIKNMPTSSGKVKFCPDEITSESYKYVTVFHRAFSLNIEMTNLMRQ